MKKRKLFSTLFFGAFIAVLILSCLEGEVYSERVAGDEPITIKGELTVLYADDFDNKRSKILYHLKEIHSGITFNMHVPKNIKEKFQTGQVITVRGRVEGRELYLALDESGQESIETVLPAEVVVSGEQNTLVIVANFRNSNVSCSVDSIWDIMFTDPTYQSIDDLYQETSLGLVWFAGDVVGPFRIDFKRQDSCDFNAWADAAEAAAVANGVDVSDYDRKVYVLPEDNTCGWSGLGSVGGSPSHAWIFRCNEEAIYGHELGHNFGMRHAATLAHEYGDTSDIMGIALAGLIQINAPHQEQMGWRTAEQSTILTKSGVYKVAPLELSASDAHAPQILKIAKPDTDEHYYLSYRQPIGFDANLEFDLTRRLHIHRYDGNGTRTLLLSGLMDDENFVDEVNGITVTHVNHNDHYALVRVQFYDTPPACIPLTPIVNFTPPSQSGVPGTTRDYTVSVTNMDSVDCSATTFSLSRSIPDALTGTLSPNILALSPETTDEAILSVTSSSSAPASTYTVSVQVSDSVDPLHTASGSADYVVLEACSPSTPTISLSPASQTASAGATLDYTVSITNMDSVGCSATTFSLSRSIPDTWTGTLSPNILALSPGTTNEAILSVTSSSSAPASTYTVSVQVSDSVDPLHTASESADYIVNAETDIDPPTAPTGLSARKKRNHVNLSWNTSSDNVGVTGYRIVRNGATLDETTETSYIDQAVSSGETYTYTVTAFDGAGNVSLPSNAATVTLNGGGKGGNK